MLEEDIIEPASGPWAAPVVIVPKASGEPRFCVDYRGLNHVTVKDRYPLPRVDESLDFLARGKFISTIDLARGYWQVGVEGSSRPKTAFASHCGLFQFKVLPFDLCNSPATFQRLMNTVLAGLVYKCCAVYLDDVVIASPTFNQHLLDLREVFTRLESAGLSLKLGKCQFCLDELKFLGYRVTPKGILPDLDKVKAVTSFPVPTNARQVRQFLGLTSYYRRFINGYAQQAEPLFALTRQDSLFLWDESCQQAMDFLKERLTSAPILCFPDFERTFNLHTDACDVGLGAALTQRDKAGQEVVVAYASRTLHKSEKPYSTTEKECLGVIWALEHFRPYIEGLPVTVYTDHSSLKWLMSRPNPTGRLARWCLRLQDFDIRIIHKPGAQNQVPDALSRNPVQSDQGPTDLLPEHAVIAGLDLRAQPVVELTNKEHLQRLQHDDPALAAILQKLESSQCTELEGDWETKFVIHEGLLYYKDSSVSCSLHPLKELKLYAPESIRGSLLKYFHDHPTAGHLGITKTVARLRLRFFWPKMRKDVKTYVLSCPVCQLTKPSQKKPAGLLVPVHTSAPWEVAGVDFVGPLPHTAAGNTYILVFVDYFSKWVEVSAVREATAKVAANKFQSEVFARHGAPKYLILDRGNPFISELFNRVVRILGSEHRLTTAYHPQTNATERVNRTLKTAIRAYIEGKHNSWDKYIPQICFALRTAPHESTGFSPAKMLYGRELATPVDLLIQPSTDGMDDPFLSPSQSLERSLEETYDHARAALKSSHKRQKHYYDLKRRPVTYQLGDPVRLKTHPRSDAVANLTAKLACVYAGPYRVVQKLSEVNYRLANMDGTDVGVVHVVNLQPFYTWTTAESKNSRQHNSSCLRHQVSHSADKEGPVGAPELLDEGDDVEEEDCAPDEAMGVENGTEGEGGDVLMPSHYDLQNRAATKTVLEPDIDYRAGCDPDVGVTDSPMHVPLATLIQG
ncbi:hypothetical protein NFI96_007544 [Prochilodus magdalenae]|nr:hypothetical protein NFI96_007544 [Prochilodus magdalenae]